MSKIVYCIFYALSLLPFKVLYLFSDIIFLFVYHVIRYRRKVVDRNLSTSFPEKSDAEIAVIRRGFYHWLCDYFVETIKLLSMSSDEMLRHIEFRNVDEMEECFDRGQACSAILGHYCNWEWLSATGLAFKRYPNAVMGLIYHPLYNKAFDDLFIKLRSHQGGVCVPKKDILRFLVKYKREQTPYLFGYIADQTPKWENIHLWLNFLNHDTPVFTNGEKIMRKMNDAVFYVEMSRPERGKYICTFRKITDSAAQMDDNAITQKFFSMLEQTIKNEPRYYLWTHDRWKRTRQEYEQRIADGRLKR
ncbi:MAG: lysophospholipid acyltransferase family protein [Prevotella sp.]|nr:lysophospholipid acyltransferase family protein [Prevotella sp.]MEE1091640.1 lysophospholipid acyltransferase family protein [Prevotella sp.]